MWLPLAVLAVLGANHLVACLNALSAPGVPIEFRYTSQSGGSVRLAADSYAFDWRSGNLRFFRPRLVRSDGSAVARLSYLAIDHLRPFYGADQLVDVRAMDLQARFVRLPDGRFELEDLLPPSTGEPSTVPFTFKLDRARIMLMDERGGKAWRQPVLATGIRVDGVGEDWMATGGVDLKDIGRATFQAEGIAKRGVVVRAKTDGLEAAPLLAHLAEAGDLAPLGDLAKARFRSLQVRGPVSFFLPAERSAQVEARLSAEATGFAYGPYRAQRASADGRLTASGYVGKAELEDGATRADFDGSVDWSGDLRLGGRLNASAPSRAALPRWARDLLPAGADFRAGRFAGWVSLAKGSPTVDGDVSGRELVWSGERLSNVAVKLHATDRLARIQIVRASLDGQPASGAFAYTYASGAVEGAMAPADFDLARLARRFPALKGLEGRAKLALRMGGTAGRPDVRFTAQGFATYAIADREPIAIDSFDLAGVWADGQVAVSRGLVRSPVGLLTVSGTVRPSGVLDLRAIGRAIDLAKLDPNATGFANLEVTVRGTLKEPLAQGRVELAQATFFGQRVTAAYGDFNANRHRLRIENLNAYRGASHVQGVAQIAWSGGLSAALSAVNVQLEDYFGAGVSGALDVSNIRLGGTVSAPKGSGRLVLSDVVAGTVKVEEASANWTLDRGVLTFDGVDADVAGGKVTGGGRINIASQTGSFAAEAAGLDLNLLAPRASVYATVEGRAAGKIAGAIDRGVLVSLDGTGDFDGVEVNDTPFGAGPWSVAFDGSRYHGSIEIGQLDRYLSLQDVAYDPQTGEVSGRADVYKFRLEDIITATLPSVPSLSFDAAERLRALAGEVIVGADFGGTAAVPRVNLETFQASDLKYMTRPFGVLEASMNVVGRRWDLKNLALNGPVGNLRASGQWLDGGAIEASGEVSKVDLAALSIVAPVLAQAGGVVDVSFDVAGQTRSPEVHASIRADRLFAARADTPDDQTLRVLLDTVTVSEADGLSVEGNYFYRGFQGQLSASAPVQYPFELAGDGLVNARVSLARRSLKEIAGLVGGIDADKTEGYVEGELKGSGTLDDFAIDGGVSLRAPALAFSGPGTGLVKSFDTSLQDVQADVRVGKNQVAATVSAVSSRSGKVSGSATTDVADFASLVEAEASGGLKALLDNAVDGAFRFESFQVRQGFEGNAFVAGGVDGELRLGGTVGSPSVSGALSASHLDAILPPFEAGASGGGAPPIDPRFNVTLALADPARLRTTAADFLLSGTGALEGSLTTPSMRADLMLERGTLKLPASTIRLEQGGTLDLRFSVKGGEADASLAVDLTGNTTLTAMRYDQTPERYDVALGLTGDLLKEGGLILNASSDPPDLSQERILSLLGQIDLLSSLATGGGGDSSERLRSALVGYALPVVFDPFTSRIANALGLEYLSLEYNLFNQASLTFAKSLGAGFFLQGVREITQPPPGFLPRYDLRLVYRPRRFRGLLNRVSFSVGSDQDRPWKLALEYGTRF